VRETDGTLRKGTPHERAYFARMVNPKYTAGYMYVARRVTAKI